jgi:hypothetical protein
MISICLSHAADRSLALSVHRKRKSPTKEKTDVSKVRADIIHGKTKIEIKPVTVFPTGSEATDTTGVDRLTKLTMLGPRLISYSRDRVLYV